MALLNPPDTLPEAMRFLVRALLAAKDRELDSDELEDLVAPSGLVDAMKSAGTDAEAAPGDDGDPNTIGKTIAKASLGGLRTLGLVQAGRKVAFTPDFPARFKRPADVGPTAFAGLLLDRVIATAEPDAPVGTQLGATDFVHAAVLLHTAADPLRPFERFEPAETTPADPRSFIDEQTSRLGNEREGRWPVVNRERWISFRRWSAYLGLARPVGSSGLLADATPAVMSRLELAPGEYDVRDFVARCGNAVPILDSGTLHVPVKDQIGFDAEVEGENAVISPGLSVTLRQMEAAGLLVLTKKSDTGVRTLRLKGNRSADEAVTHVTWTPKAATGRRGSS